MSKIHLGIFLGIFLFCSALDVHSQSTDQILEAGHRYFNKGDYFGASIVYNKAMDVDSSNAAVLYHYSKSLMETMQMEKASRYLFKLSLIDRGEEFPDVYYLLAESYRGSGDYRKARRYYSKALLPYRRDRNSYWYKKIKQNKDANQWALKQSIASNDQIKAVDPKFNTDASEFAPRIKNGVLYFSSLKADSILEGGIVEDEQYFNRLYFSNLDREESPTPIQFERAERFQDKHLANISLSKNGNMAYFSVCDTNYNCEIWKASIHSNKLTDLAPLNKNINYPNANNTQAEIVEYKGNEYIIFASDRPKGFGGLDLWVAEKKDFGFDQALNLGATINTPSDEITPYYQDGWLYFSSDWHEGLGGFDIFKTKGWLSNYEVAENLGSPINSAADDYYFSRSNDQALLSSNRSLDKSNNYCCNDLYFLPYDEDLIEQDSSDLKPDSIVADIISLNKYLPLDLYFHNDMPDPNSKDSTTKKNYIRLAQKYLEMREEYLEKMAESQVYVKDEDLAIRIESFFEDEVTAGLEDLEFFTPILLKSLEAGNQIELTIRGFASSISEADYNLNLTLRRIESLINYFKEYEGGKFSPYLNQTAENGGSLSIVKIPFGEFAIQDKSLENDKVLAVYSPQAALQRKIELIAISKQDGESKRFDSKEKYKTPKIDFNSTSYDIGEIENGSVNRFFIVKNNGESTLEIYNVMVNCECAQIEFPSELEAGEEGKVSIEIDTKNMKGPTVITLTVVSNAKSNLTELSIQLNKQ